MTRQDGGPAGVPGPQRAARARRAGARGPAGARPPAWDAAMRAYLLGRDVMPDEFTLDTSRRNRLGGALRAAAADGRLPPGLVDAALALAVAAVADGSAYPEDVWWAAGNGWLWSGPRPGPADPHRRDRHDWLGGPTPTDLLAPFLGAYVALRPLVGTRRPQVCGCGLHATGRRSSSVARRAVAGLGGSAGPWVTYWARGARALKLTGRAALVGFPAFVRDHARPWQSAMPAGQDVATWVLLEVPAWRAAGFTVDETACLAALPAGHPDRPDADRLAVMAALRG